MENNRLPGRPRSHDVDAAILSAAVQLLGTKGPEGLTVNAVARRSGVARASIYLRYPSRQALLGAALRAAIGRAPYRLTGDIVADLAQGAAQAQAIFDTPSFRAILPEVIRGLLQQAGEVDGITSDMVAPNRRPIAEAYRRSAEAAGLRTDIDPDLPFKLILGGMLMSLLADGVPPTREEAAVIANVVIRGLRDEPDAPTSARRTRRTSGPA
jgi:AcrR family transcriptional regulator